MTKQNNENSVSCALDELMCLEDDRQKSIEEEQQRREKAEIQTRHKQELVRLEEERLRKVSEESKRKREKDEEDFIKLMQEAKANAVLIEAQAKAELAAIQAQQTHEKELAAIEAKTKTIPRFIWGIITAIVFIGLIAGYVQYQDSQEEKAKIRQAAEVQKIQLEQEKASIQQEREIEAAMLKAKAESNARIAQEKDAKLTEAERRLKEKNKVIPTTSRKSVRQRSRTIKKPKSNMNSTDPLRGLDL